jgi:hypothetical protein
VLHIFRIVPNFWPNDKYIDIVFRSYGCSFHITPITKDLKLSELTLLVVDAATRKEYCSDGLKKLGRKL